MPSNFLTKVMYSVYAYFLDFPFYASQASHFALALKPKKKLGLLAVWSPKVPCLKRP